MYYGESFTILDGKKRLAIPATFRRVMEQEDHRVWYITRGYDRALFMFREETWEQLLKNLPNAPLDPQVLSFRRFFLGASIRVEPDAQWRIALSDGLKDFALLERECAILGVEDHLEIWNKSRWTEYSLQNMDDYKARASEIFSGHSASTNIQEEAKHVND
ncbi:MAG TPA: cell division/cell wall cluster transcriptional repressor MraZ [Candidatus Hydrogenedentes bacterium]|jgi:MraZ protein|nr:cell division/cell wall cluster transcriptional repressor MraZ [Candidatus Hydrogenedentota bacterium]HOR50278.1 cell division/cell wall cluster transcriptional repressor MraZ [Candidatus Hydrogenedentota bacterium]